MSLDLTDDKSTLVQVMAWCHQAANHCLSHCWPRSMLPAIWHYLGHNELMQKNTFNGDVSNSIVDVLRPGDAHICMLCTAQLGGPVLKASGRVQHTSFGLGDKSPMITNQHTAGGSVSQLSQLTKLSSWLTLSTKDITTSFWHYKRWFCFLSNQIMGLYHFSNTIE